MVVHRRVMCVALWCVAFQVSDRRTLQVERCDRRTVQVERGPRGVLPAVTTLCRVGRPCATSATVSCARPRGPQRSTWRSLVAASLLRTRERYPSTSRSQRPSVPHPSPMLRRFCQARHTHARAQAYAHQDTRGCARVQHVHAYTPRARAHTHTIGHATQTGSSNAGSSPRARTRRPCGLSTPRSPLLWPRSALTALGSPKCFRPVSSRRR